MEQNALKIPVIFIFFYHYFTFNAIILPGFVIGMIRAVEQDTCIYLKRDDPGVKEDLSPWTGIHSLYNCFLLCFGMGSDSLKNGKL